MNTHSLQLATVPFNAIISGQKVIESRLYDDKRQLIKIGDIIEFTNRESPDQKALVKVIDLLQYETFHDLFSDNNPAKFGGESVEWLAGSIKIAYCIPAIAVTMLETLETRTTYRARTASSCKRQLHQHHITERERINPSKYDEHLPIEKLEAARIQNTRVNRLIEIFEKGLDWEELKMEVEA